MTVKIYHNADCGTSRDTLAMICKSGEEPIVIEYLKNPPSRDKLEELIKAMRIPVRSPPREKDTPCAALGLSDAKRTDEQRIDFIIEHPILINRPIVFAPRGTRLCRPSEKVLEILDNPNIGAFTEENGEVAPARV